MKDGFELSFDVRNLDSSSRTFHGLASDETLDFENEKVLVTALEKAIEGYMQLPIVHEQHTERSVAYIEKATVDSRGLWVEGKVPMHKQWDDVWDRIEKGDLSQFSIKGRRTNYSEACRIKPGARSSPCVTSGLFLDSISICKSGTAVNPATFLEIKKALESTEDVINSEHELSNNEISSEESTSDEESTMTENTEQDVQKGVDATEISELKESISALTDIIKGMKTETPEPENVPEQVADPILDLKKSLDERFTSLEDRLSKIEEMDVQKGNDVVVIPEQVDPTEDSTKDLVKGLEDLGFNVGGNARAIDRFYGGK